MWAASLLINQLIPRIEPSPTGEHRGPEHCKQLVLLEEKEGWGSLCTTSQPLGANPEALRTPQRGAQGCSRCLHPQEMSLQGTRGPGQEKSPARRGSSSGSRQETGTEGWAELQMAQFTPGQAAETEPLPLLILSLGFFVPLLVYSWSPLPSLLQ